VREKSVLELAQMLRTTPRERVFGVTADHVRAGASPREVLGATLLAGIQDVRPWPPGTKFHVVLMVPSALELAERSAPEDLWLPVFFNIDVLKNSQDRDISEGDWELPPPPRPLTDDPSKARRALIASMEEWDVATADRAVTAAVRLLELDELFEIFWPMGARDFVNIGHKMIHVSQVYRALEMLDGAHREPVLRSLVHGLLGGGPGAMTVPFDRNRERLTDLPPGWEDGGVEPDASGELFVQLRTATPEQAVNTVVELLGRGVSPKSVWDGLRVAASEMLFRLRQSDVRNAQLLGVHPLTILNALYYAYRKTSRDATRRLLLLQAAAWMPMARDLLQRAKGLSLDAPGFDALDAPKEPVGVTQAVQEADRDYIQSASLVLRVAQSAESADDFIDRCRALVVRKAPEHHHHKYAAAAFEEFRQTHPRFSPYLLATCLSYLPTPGNGDSDVTQRARAALRG
jgi:hypothetical protein